MHDHGPFSRFVNNAAMAVAGEVLLGAGIDDLDLVSWEAAVARDLTTTWLLSRAVLRGMRDGSTVGLAARRPAPR